MHAWLASPIVQGALTGFLSAAALDYLAFRKFQRWGEFTTYDWSVASFRWFQGIVVGAVGAFAIQFGLTILQ